MGSRLSNLCEYHSRNEKLIMLTCLLGVRNASCGAVITMASESVTAAVLWRRAAIRRYFSRATTFALATTNSSSISSTVILEMRDVGCLFELEYRRRGDEASRLVGSSIFLKEEQDVRGIRPNIARDLVLNRWYIHCSEIGASKSFLKVAVYVMPRRSG
jgi:hypothetical protein